MSSRLPSARVGVGCALLATSGIITSAISAHDLHPWVLNQPRGFGFGLPIGQKIYWHPLFEIDEDRTEGSGTQKAEIIHPENAWGRMLFLTVLTNTANQALSLNEVHAGGDEKRLDAHVH